MCSIVQSTALQPSTMFLVPSTLIFQASSFLASQPSTSLIAAVWITTLGLCSLKIFITTSLSVISSLMIPSSLGCKSVPMIENILSLPNTFLSFVPRNPAAPVIRIFCFAMHSSYFTCPLLTSCRLSGFHHSSLSLNHCTVFLRASAKSCLGFHPSFFIFEQSNEYLRSWPGRSVTSSIQEESFFNS